MKTLRRFLAPHAFSAFALAALVGFTISFAGFAQAAPLNLDSTPPDITTSFISVRYDHSLRELTALYGWPSMFNVDGTEIYWSDAFGGMPNFTLTMTLDSVEDVPVDGSLLIEGTIEAVGATSGTLLTGNVVALGFDETGVSQTLEFIFDVTGGDLMDPYFPSQVGVLLHDTGFGGSFGSSFMNDGMSMSDAYAVPEPSSGVVLLTLIGSVCFVSVSRKLWRV